MEEAREHLRRWLDGMQAAVSEQYRRMEMVMRGMPHGTYGQDDLDAINRRIADLNLLGHLGATLARFLAPDLLTPTTAPADSAALPAASPCHREG